MRKPQFWMRYVSLDKTHTRRESPVRNARRGCCAAAVPPPRLASPSAAVLEPRRDGTKPCASAAMAAERRQCRCRTSLLLISGARAAARCGTKPCAPAAVTAARRQCCRRASLPLGSGARAAALVRSRARLRRWLLRCGSASIAMVYYTSASIAILHYTYTCHTRLVCGTSPLPSVVGAQRAAPGPSRCGREPSHCCHSVGLAAAPGCKTGPAPARA